MSEQVLSMVEPQKKLRELAVHMPNQREKLYELGVFLADRLGDGEIVPMGFVMGCELAICDLQAGVDGYSGKSINNGLVGYPPQFYGAMSMFIPIIAKAVFPAEFAAEVEQFIKSVK